MKPQSIYRERTEQCLILAEVMTDQDARIAMLEAAYQRKLLPEIAERYSPPPADADEKSSKP